MAKCVSRDRDRTVLFLANPTLWPTWPFLPVVRRSQGREELGVVFDARHVCGFLGYSATVFLTLCGAPHNVSYADSAVMRSWWR